MVRVLIADDSNLTRHVVKDLLARDPNITVIGEAADGAEAVRATQDLGPDLVIMDVMMPVMDGLTAVTEIMASRPTPVLVLSGNVDSQDSLNAFNAIRLGALDVMEKPKGVGTDAFEEIAAGLVEKVKMLARVRVMHHFRRRKTAEEPTISTRAKSRSLLAIGASTGGPKAVMRLMKELPAEAPCSVLIVQHIAQGFAAGFADWLNRESSFKVRVAHHGDALEPGVALVAPNDRHLEIERNKVVFTDFPPVNCCRPSVDVLFRSLARSDLAPKVLAVLLTGMGQDGAEGMADLRARGSYNIVQDETSSAVYGMPRAAVSKGGVHRVLPLVEIPPVLAQILRG